MLKSLLKFDITMNDRKICTTCYIITTPAMLKNSISAINKRIEDRRIAQEAERVRKEREKEIVEAKRLHEETQAKIHQNILDIQIQKHREKRMQEYEQLKKKEYERNRLKLMVFDDWHTRTIRERAYLNLSLLCSSVFNEPAIVDALHKYEYITDEEYKLCMLKINKQQYCDELNTTVNDRMVLLNFDNKKFRIIEELKRSGLNKYNNDKLDDIVKEMHNNRDVESYPTDINFNTFVISKPSTHTYLATVISSNLLCYACYKKWITYDDFSWYYYTHLKSKKDVDIRMVEIHAKNAWL